MSLISLSHVSKHFGAEPVLADVSFRLERGEHAGLVGVNGAGKSTLLRLIAGLEEPDSGSVDRSRNLLVVYLPQEPEFDGAETLYAAMLAVFRQTIDAQERLRVLEREMAAGGHNPRLVEEYGHLQALVEHTGYDYRQRIDRVLAGLGLEPDLWDSPLDQLSGGQRTRAHLARTLLQDADLLLLDEPTNHLDIAAVEWLETYLRELRQAFLIVAHDRYLLDRVTTRTLELSRHQITAYDAPYSRYLELRAERQARHHLDYEAQQRHIAQTEEFIRRYGAGQRYKEARGRQKQLDRLERIARPDGEETVHLSLSKAQRSGDVALTLERLVAGYPDLPLIRLPDEIVVNRGEKIAIIGPNGSGKTTLLRTLTGAISPLQGKVRWGAGTTIGYYSQTLEQLDERRTVLAEVQAGKAMGEEEARGYLGRFLFSGDDAFKSVAVLSGGEKSRVALAKLILEEPNVLVLDEPTNHLDIASRDALERVLQGFGGTVLFVSHDRYLIDSLAHQLWVVQDGKLRRYAGGYAGFAQGESAPLDTAPAAAGARTRLDPQLPPDERLAHLEEEAATLAAHLAGIGPSASLSHLAGLMDQYAALQTDVQEAEGAWLRRMRQGRAFSA